MRIELPVRLAHPLNICLVFISIAGFNFLNALGLGFSKYIIVLVIIMVISWFLQKSGLNEKEVPIWAGGFIIIGGFINGMILQSLVTHYI